MKIEHTYVINLKDKQERWNNIQTKFKDTGLKLKRWDAVYGKKLDDNYIKSTSTPYCYNFCSNGMIGAWLSHYNLWKYIVENNLNNVLILEDDANPVDNFNDRIKILDKAPTDADIIYLGCIGTCNINNDYVNKKYNDDFIKPLIPLQAHAYILTNRGAKKLLKYKELKKVSSHIDVFLAFKIYTKDDFNVYATRDNLIYQNDINTSAITNNNHYIINKLCSNIYIDKNNTMDYFINSPVLSIRKINYDITGLLLIFIILMTIITIKCKSKVVLSVLILILILFLFEYTETRSRNIIIDYMLILLFTFMVYKIHKN